MFVHMSIHYPIPGKQDLILDAMRRYCEAMKGKPGLQSGHALRDRKTGKLIGLAIWDTREDWAAAKPAMDEAVKNDPFHEWEDVPPKVYHLEEVLF